jgi:hypothetical protein
LDPARSEIAHQIHLLLSENVARAQSLVAQGHYIEADQVLAKLQNDQTNDDLLNKARNMRRKLQIVVLGALPHSSAPSFNAADSSQILH